MIWNNLMDKRVILGSQSPRRMELLKSMGITFETRVADLDEKYPGHLQKEEIPLFLAQLKADFLSNDLNNEDVLITSDTIVWYRDQALNKPQNKAEAFKMLSMLSGNTHSVYSAIHVRYNGKTWNNFDQTLVTFNALSDEEIHYYIDQYAPFDKAGSYGAQDFIGLIGIEKLEGSYFNVMGLPTHLLYQILKSL
jgi:septum formation protein